MGLRSGASLLRMRAMAGGGHGSLTGSPAWRRSPHASVRRIIIDMRISSSAMQSPRLPRRGEILAFVPACQRNFSALHVIYVVYVLIPLATRKFSEVPENRSRDRWECRRVARNQLLAIVDK